MAEQSVSGSGSVSRRDVLKATAAVSAASLVSGAVTYTAHAAGSDAIKIGLVGCGSRGRGAVLNAMASAAGVELVALADIFPDQMADAVEGFKARDIHIPESHRFMGFDGYKRLMALPEVNYLILATPPTFRPVHIKAGIEAGKNVFAEKPVAICPTGCRMLTDTAKVAHEKKLGFISGTQRRHDPKYVETIMAIHDGAIGQLISGQVYWLQGGAWMKPRKPEWSDTEWQLRNWMYFTWISGDHIVEQHMHQHDIANWVLGGPPKLCIGMGGRQSRTDPAYGMIYDHFAVEYEYDNDVHVISLCRQVENTYGRVSEKFQGTKGWAFPSGTIVTNDKKRWRPTSAGGNPYEFEHGNLIKSIREGQPLNDMEEAATSALTAIMGRMSAYTGKLVTWRQATDSKLSLLPPEDLAFGPMETPAVPIPGKEELI